MKLITWNVNGIRAAARGDFLNWFEKESADIICIQETKANAAQLGEELLHPQNYNSYWHSAQKAGYSGVAIYSKKEPLSIQTGIGIPTVDSEGRVLIAEYSHFVMINAYFPNSQRDHARLGYKLEFCNQMLQVLDQFKHKGKQVILCGDFNIAHREIDLKNPKSNMNNAGFLPEERAWMGKFLEQGYVDVFRHFNPDPGHYTWWSYRPGVREKNIGWRLDYFVVNEEFKDRLKASAHQIHIKGSDHCPVVAQLRD
jgi:exodeoxyribonuclease-3